MESNRASDELSFFNLNKKCGPVMSMKRVKSSQSFKEDLTERHCVQTNIGKMRPRYVI